MSTPSIATATLPSHQIYNYPPSYQSTSVSTYPTPSSANNASAATTNAAAASRVNPNANAYTTYPAPADTVSSAATTSQPHPSSKQSSLASSMPQTQAAPAQAANGSASSSRKKQPDWNEFYKNGVPKEIIVIDDSPEPTSPAMKKTQARRPAPPASTPSTSKMQPAAKKRRTGGTENHTAVYDRPSFSHLPQQFGDDVSVATHSVSTDRTTSLQTTAPTSLGSHGSLDNGLGANGGVSYEDANVGQKRKRVTRKTTRDEQVNKAYDYVSPPKPLIKAGEVHVPVIREKYVACQKYDDEDGHYVVQPATLLADRYEIVRLLGQGTFGKVVQAIDRKKGNHVAVKIIRSIQKYRDASRIELRVLTTLASNDKYNRNKCIHLRDCFDFRNHICIVTDLLGQSVFDFLKGNQFVPFPNSQIQNFARQLFTSVAFLHDLNLIHTDLKPENILLVKSDYQTFTYNKNIPSSSHITSRNARTRRVLLDSEIRLIDFGSATFDDEYHSSVVSTRHYRAPEIILNLGWSFPCDIWSIGCILVEFFTGDALFQTHDNLEHLAMMEAVCGGKIDAKLVKQVQAGGRGNTQNSAAKYFTRSKLDYPNNETTRASKKYVKGMKHLHDFIPATTTFNKQFLDLLRKIFVYDPKSRISAKQALKHPWFQESTVDDGTEAAKIKIKRQKEKEEEQRLAAAAAAEAGRS